MLENSSHPLQIAVCDDETADRAQILAQTEEILRREALACSISSYGSASDLLAVMQNGKSFHILILDVMMGELSGMELAAALRKLGDRTAIIFISSNQEMALRGYEVSAARYLSKPVQAQLLREAILYCCRTNYERKEIMLPTVRGQCRILLSDIVYAEAIERVTKLILKDRPEKLNMKFSDLSDMLPGHQFILCHRSYLVNLDYVGYVRNRELELTTGDVLPVSKYRQRELQQKLVDYLSY